MKQTILILAVIFLSLTAKAQMYSPIDVANGVQMTATQTTTQVDRKFEEVKRCLGEANIQVKRILIQESIQNNVKNKVAINTLLSDIQAVVDAAATKFTVKTYNKITVDSLRTVTEKANLTTEIARLKAETLIVGADSAMIRPQIDQLKARRADLTRIINNWVPVQ